MAERTSLSRKLDAEGSRVSTRTRRLGGDVTNRIDFWVDQLNQLRRAKAATLPGDEIIGELDKQIAATAKQIEDLGGDLSALSPETAGANFAEPTNVTVEQVKPKAETPNSGPAHATTVQARGGVSSGEIAKTSGVTLPEPELGRRQFPSRTRGVGVDVGNLAGTMDLEGTADDLARKSALRGAGKALGVLALPVGIMSELEGTSLNADEPAFLTIANAVAQLPAFKTASYEERQRMVTAAFDSARATMAKLAEDRMAERTGKQQVGGLRSPNSARPYVAGGKVPPEIQEEANRQVPPQPPQPAPQAVPPRTDGAGPFGMPTPGSQSTPQTTTPPTGPTTAPPQTPQGVAAQVGIGTDPNVQQASAQMPPPGVAAPPAAPEQQAPAPAPQPQPQMQQTSAPQGVAAPPPQQGQNYAQTKDSRSMDQQEWADLLGRMKQKGIKGFNFAGYAFEADKEMPSGYRVIYDRGVAKNRPEGVDRKEKK